MTNVLVSSTPSTRATRRLGVEEEFHLVDLSSRRLAPRAPEVLQRLDDDSYVAELMSCVVEINSDVVDTLPELRDELVRRRRVLRETAADLGMGIVATGSVPLGVPEEVGVTEAPRFRRMLAEYQMLAREQLICGTQVHVDVSDRDEAVAVAGRVAPHLATFLALSASSPFASDGSDSGYASMRSLVWQRWPTAGPLPEVGSASEYDALLADLMRADAITDPGMVYFDVRPSASAPTLELRICDSCPSVDTIVLIAGLFRALVDREAAAYRAGSPAKRYEPTLVRSAVWRAARFGLEGDLLDLERGRSRPAGEVVRDMVDALREQLTGTGDVDLVEELARGVLVAGSSAARQRRVRRRRGRLTDVVDLLVAETAAARVEPRHTHTGALFDSYVATPTEAEASLGPAAPDDEALTVGGDARESYVEVLGALSALGRSALRYRESAIEDLQRADGITFKVTGQETRVFPLDVAPRIITADDWAHISAGAAQRTRALDAFLQDVYSDQQIVADGVVPASVLDRSPGYRSSGLLGGRGVRAHVSGLDIACGRGGDWCVIEDNLRIPSGLSYAIWNRALIDRFLPELPRPAGLLPVEEAAITLLETLRAAAPSRSGDDPQVAVLTSGEEDSAYAEHADLATRMGVPLVRPDQMRVENARILLVDGPIESPIDVLYARMDEDMFFSSVGADGSPLGPGIVRALHRGGVRIANAFGNGIGDDKAVYAYVPAMIDYYLGEKPILRNLRTWVCADRESRDHVVAHVDQLVTKPVDGFGGAGVLIGPDATDAELDARRLDLATMPEKFIAQEVVALSTHPTFDGEVMRPHHVDLRVYAHLRLSGTRTEAVVLPAALTRVAPAGSRIVNSSAGGGSKDTWILDERVGA